MITKIIQSLIIIFFEAICCMYFLNIFLFRKNHLKRWVMKSRVFFITAGFFLIAVIVPHFLIKSILTIIIIIITTKIFYKSNMLQSIVLSSVFYGILVGIDYLLMVILKLMLPERYTAILHNTVSGTMIALLCKTILLFVVMAVKRIWKPKDNLDKISNKEWLCLFCFPLVTIMSMAGMLYGSTQISENVLNIFLLIAFGFVAMNFLVFFLIQDIVNRESEIQVSGLIQERTKNQMNIYRNMYDTYESQRKKSHDYMNQLVCIQGMLMDGNTDQTIEYINKLTGNIKRDMDIVHTNNPVVDAVVNQKYRYAQTKGVTFIMMVSDLSALTMN